MSESEPEFEHISAAIYNVVKSLNPQLSRLYVTWHSLVNYTIVCGTGLFINNTMQKILYARGKFLGWFLVNNFAIAIAMLWSWAFTAGPYGYLFGLSPPGWWKKTRKQETE